MSRSIFEKPKFSKRRGKRGNILHQSGFLGENNPNLRENSINNSHPTLKEQDAGRLAEEEKVELDLPPSSGDACVNNGLAEDDIDDPLNGYDENFENPDFSVTSQNEDST